MAGKRSNGEGSISYDKRRKRYRAKITIGWEKDESTGRSKQITKTLGSNYKTKGEASAALAEYLKNPFDLSNKDITFSQLYQKWYDDFLTEDNISQKYRIKAAYRYCSSIYDKKVREITVLDMKDCVYKGTALCTKGKYKGQQRPSTPQTKESIKFLFNHMFAYATEARLIERNYAKDFTLDKKVQKEKEKNRKVKIPFSDEEMNKLWESMEFVPFADMIVFACYSGWRPGELILLRVKDVDLEKGFIKGGIKSSAGRNRLVPIHHKVASIVEKYYNEAIEIRSEYLFNDPGTKWGLNGFSKDQYATRFNNVILALNFRDELTPHYTRHTFITRAKSAGVDEYILKLIVGHDIKDLTEHIYTHRELEELKREIEKVRIVKGKTEDKLSEEEERELYELFLKLKEKFE